MGETTDFPPGRVVKSPAVQLPGSIGMERGYQDKMRYDINI